MKKIISLILALMLVLCMGAAAFAEGTTGDTTTTTPSLENVQDKGPTVSKLYKINNGTAPAETFTFKFEGVSYKNGDGQIVSGATIPAIGNVTIDFDAINVNLNKTVTASINANDYELGVYTYKVTEVVSTTKTTGVTYSDETLYLVLTILRDETSGRHYVAAMHYESATSTDKSTGFTNEYDSGSLTVKKLITGNMADMSKKFAFTITFTAPANTQIESTITSDSTNGTWSEDGLTYTISLGNNETVTLSNIPAGTTYTVIEDPDGYTSTSTFDDETKTISANDRDNVTFTNDKTQGIDMGVSTDSLPYITLLGIVALIGAAMIIKRRATND